MEQNRVKRERYNKKVLGGREIYCSKETPFFLISETTVLSLETMDVMHAP